MWFYDDQSEDCKKSREQARALGREHLDLRQLLQAAENNLEAHPKDGNFQARVRDLTEKIKYLEERAPLADLGLNVGVRECRINFDLTDIT